MSMRPLWMLLFMSAVLSLGRCDDEHDDWRAARKCARPGECTEGSGRDQQTASGVRVVQLLSGRDHAVESTATTPQQRRLFQQAKAMMNYQYLIGDAGTSDVVLVDGAWDPKGIMKFAHTQGLTIVGYIATHFHYDHIGAAEGAGMAPSAIPGIAEFVDKHGMRAYLHEIEVEQALAWSGIKNRSLLQPVVNGSTLHLGGVTVEFLLTPGHSPGGVSLVLSVDGKSQSIVTGDTLFPGSCGRVDLPHSSKRDMHHSLQSVLAKQPDHLVVFPGHGYSQPQTTIGEEKRSGLLRPIPLQQWLRMMQ